MFEKIPNLFTHEVKKREAIKHDGEKSDIRISRKTSSVGEGAEAKIDEVDVLIGNRKRKLIRKKFGEPFEGFGRDEIKTPEDALSYSIENYDLLKSAGLETIPVTYRKISDTEVLMTNLNTKDRVAISYEFMNGRDSEFTNDFLEEEISLEYIDDKFILDLIDQVSNDIKKATDAGIIIHSDSYMFTVPRKLKSLELPITEDNRIGIKIADFGNIDRQQKDSIKLFTANTNTDQLSEAVIYAFRSLVSESHKHGDLKKIVEEKTHELWKEIKE